jgi:hypothetical protein
MTRDKRIDLHNLQTMEQVRRERLRLSYAIRHAEQLLERDGERIGEICRPSYWIDIFSRMAADWIETATGSISARIRHLVSGWGIFERLFCTPPARRGRAEKVWVEEDIVFVPADKLEAEIASAKPRRR